MNVFSMKVKIGQILECVYSLEPLTDLSGVFNVIHTFWTMFSNLIKQVFCQLFYFLYCDHDKQFLTL
jgi:hypothetical protein